MNVIERIETLYTGKDAELCIKAHDFAKKAHENQKRASGEEYFIHPSCRDLPVCRKRRDRFPRDIRSLGKDRRYSQWM